MATHTYTRGFIQKSAIKMKHSSYNTQEVNYREQCCADLLIVKKQQEATLSQR